MTAADNQPTESASASASEPGSATNGDITHPVVLDASVITRLARELHSYPDALAFVDQYTAMLTDRITAIHTELTGPGTDDQLSALLSLHASSAMTGATQLHHTTQQAITALTTGTPPAHYAQTLHQRLTLEADGFITAYTRFRTQAPGNKGHKGRA